MREAVSRVPERLQGPRCIGLWGLGRQFAAYVCVAGPVSGGF